MQTPSGLLSTLEDTQASLATALARIEAYRLREKYLLRENYRLREELKQTDGQTLEQALKSTVSRRFRNTEGSETPREELATRTLQTRESIHYRLHEEYPIILYTKKGKVPASLSANPDCIEVYESKARISATQFVGMTNLSAEKKLASKSWTSYLFGKSKATEDMASPKKASRKGADGVTFRPKTPPNLERSSWGGTTEAHSLGSEDRKPQAGSTSVWQVLWKDGGGGSKLKQLVFEASVAAQSFINRQIETWSDAASRAASIEESQVAKQPTVDPVIPELEQTSSFAAEGMVVPPKHLVPDGPFPGMSTKSELLNEELVRCLTSAVPPRFRHSTWNLIYSTDKHGISLQTLYRKAAGIVPTILLVKDNSDFIFGGYCSEAWKMGPRFYGTGETFVFQLEPHRVYYPWKQDSKVRNNFFMFGSPDSLAVGGTGHFAIWLDSELLYGHSGLCDTFGSPCIASKEEFKIIKLELWGLN